jgi:hypothetical protein
MQEHFPGDVIVFLCQFLDTRDLLSLICAEKTLNTLLTHKPLWLQRAKHCGIYQSEFEDWDISKIKARLIMHMKNIYRNVRTICPVEYPKLLSHIVIEDDAKALEDILLQSSTRFATALMPIAIVFGRVNIMHSLFTHYHVTGSYHWLLQAIRDESFSSVRYLVEKKGVPLITQERSALFACSDTLWNPSFELTTHSGHYCATSYLHFNKLLLTEIIRCRDPKIIHYLKNKLYEQLNSNDSTHPERILFAKVNRHSLELLEVNHEDESAIPKSATEYKPNVIK